MTQPRIVYVVEVNNEPIDHAYVEEQDAMQAAAEIEFETAGTGAKVEVVRYVPEATSVN